MSNANWVFATLVLWPKLPKLLVFDTKLGYNNLILKKLHGDEAALSYILYYYNKLITQ